MPRIPIAGDDLDARAQLVVERDTVARDREDLLALVMREHPAWASAQTPAPFDGARDLDALPKDWCALSAFWLGERELHLFLARPREPIFHHAETWSPDELQDLRASQEELRAATTGRLFVLLVTPEALASRVLSPAVLEQLRPHERLLVSPHGLLRGVRFTRSPAKRAG